LNSLIQALYMTPELRAGLFDLSLDDLQVVTTAPPPPVAAATAPEPDAAAAAATTEQDSDKSEEPTPSGPSQAEAEHTTVPAAEPATVCHRTTAHAPPHAPHTQPTDLTRGGRRRW
jgi:hypothetical protein